MVKPVVAGQTGVSSASAAEPAGEPQGQRMLKFVIPLGDAREETKGACGNGCAGCECASGSTVTEEGATKAGAVQRGVELAKSVVMGRKISAEAVEVLKEAFARPADGVGFVVPQPKLDAAKRELLRFWGFPEGFVREYGARVELEHVEGTTGVIRPDGSVYGSFGDARTRFFGFVHKNDDWTKPGIDGIMSIVIVPEAAKRLTLPELFYERCGVTTREERDVLTDRLYQALSNWKTISDAEVVWAKSMLATGYQLEGELRLDPFAKGGSAVDVAQSLRGTLTVGTKIRSLGLALDSGIVATAPGGVTVRVLD